MHGILQQVDNYISSGSNIFQNSNDTKWGQ